MVRADRGGGDLRRPGRQRRRFRAQSLDRLARDDPFGAAGLRRGVAEARRLEATDPASAEGRYRSMIARQPGFAEAPFRLGRLRERAGDWPEAIRLQTAARELDAMPQRCRSAFQDAVREVGAAHRAIVVDAPAVFRRLSDHGQLDDGLFHDAHHPTMRGYLALARDALEQMGARKSLGWPEASPVPDLEPDVVAEHFRIDRPFLAEVCRRSAVWFERDAFIRFDPAERLAKSARDFEAAGRILSGEAPEDVGVPGLGWRKD